MADLPKKYEKIIDDTMDKDILYFKEHPEATEYERDLVDGEFFPIRYPPGTRVRVVQMVPGLRQRQVLSDDFTFYPNAASYQASPEVVAKYLGVSSYGGKKRLKRRKRP